MQCKRGQEFIRVYGNNYFKNWAGTKGAQAPRFRGLAHLHLMIHITNTQLNCYIQALKVKFYYFFNECLVVHAST